MRWRSLAWMGSGAMDTLAILRPLGNGRARLAHLRVGVLETSLLGQELPIALIRLPQYITVLRLFHGLDSLFERLLCRRRVVPGLVGCCERELQLPQAAMIFARLRQLETLSGRLDGLLWLPLGKIQGRQISPRDPCDTAITKTLGSFQALAQMLLGFFVMGKACQELPKEGTDLRHQLQVP